MRRLAGTLLAASAVAAGCGGDDQEREREPPPVRVAEQGFSQVGRSVLVGAVLRNDAPEPAVGVEVAFEVRDERGAVIGEATENLVFIPARQGFNVGVEIELDDEGARARDVRIGVEVGEEDAFAGDEPPAELPRVGAVDVTRMSEALIVLAQVESRLPVSSITDVYAVLRDEDNKIVGGLTSVNLQPDGDQATAFLSTIASPRGVADADVSVDAETD